MKKKELLKQLNNLKETIKPDSSWQEANRDILLSQINAQTRLDFEKTKVQLMTKKGQWELVYVESEDEIILIHLKLRR